MYALPKLPLAIALLSLLTCLPTGCKKSQDENSQDAVKENTEPAKADAANKQEANGLGDTAKADDANKDAKQDDADKQEGPKEIALEVFEPEVKTEETSDGITTTHYIRVYTNIPNDKCLCKNYGEMGADADPNCGECELKSLFVMEEDLKAFNLKAGDIFISNHAASGKYKGGKLEVVDGKGESVYAVEIETEVGEDGGSAGSQYTDFNPCDMIGHEKDCKPRQNNSIVRVKVLSEADNAPNGDKAETAK